MTKLATRKARSEDIPAFVDLAEELHNLHNPASFDRVWKTDWLQTFLGRRGNFALIVESQTPVAYLLAETRCEEYTGTAFLYVREVYISATYRRQSIGIQLIDQAMHTAREMGCRYVALNVRAGNPVLEFFTKEEFSVFSLELRRPL